MEISDGRRGSGTVATHGRGSRAQYVSSPSASDSSSSSSGSVIDNFETDREYYRPDLDEFKDLQDSESNCFSKSLQWCCGGCKCRGCTKRTSWLMLLGSVLILGTYMLLSLWLISAFVSIDWGAALYRVRDLKHPWDDDSSMQKDDSAIWWIVSNDGKLVESGSPQLRFLDSDDIGANLFLSPECGSRCDDTNSGISRICSSGVCVAKASEYQYGRQGDSDERYHTFSGTRKNMTLRSVVHEELLTPQPIYDNNSRFKTFHLEDHASISLKRKTHRHVKRRTSNEHSEVFQGAAVPHHVTSSIFRGTISSSSSSAYTNENRNRMQMDTDDRYYLSMSMLFGMSESNANASALANLCGKGQEVELLASNSDVFLYSSNNYVNYGANAYCAKSTDVSLITLRENDLLAGYIMMNFQEHDDSPYTDIDSTNLQACIDSALENDEAGQMLWKMHFYCSVTLAWWTIATVIINDLINILLAALLLWYEVIEFCLGKRRVWYERFVVQIIRVLVYFLVGGQLLGDLNNYWITVAYWALACFSLFWVFFHMFYCFYWLTPEDDDDPTLGIINYWFDVEDRAVARLERDEDGKYKVVMSDRMKAKVDAKRAFEDQSSSSDERVDDMQASENDDDAILHTVDTSS